MSGFINWKNKKIESTTEKRKLIQHWTSYSILALAVISMTFFGICTPGQQGSLALISGNAGRVAGEVITDLEFKRNYQAAFDNWRKQNPEQNFDPASARLSEAVLNQLVDSRVEYLAAKSIGLTSSEQEVVELLKTNRYLKNEDGSFNKEGFSNFLRSNLYTEAEFTSSTQKDLIQNKFTNLVNKLQFVSDQEAEMEFKRREEKVDYEYIKLTPAMIDKQIDAESISVFLAVENNLNEIKKQFEQKKSQLSKPEEVKARHILIGFKDARNATGEATKRTKEEAKVKASQVLNEVKKAGVDFASVAKKFTDEPSGKSSGGDLGWFSKDRMVVEFSDAAFALKPGEISGIVESPFGFHIIKSEGYKESVVADFEKEKISLARSYLRDQKAVEILNQKAEKYLAALQAKQDVSKMLKEDQLNWESTGPVAVSSRYIPGLGVDEGLVDAVSSIKEVGQVAPTVLSSGTSRYIVRLKSKISADMSKFKEQKELIVQRLKYQKAMQSKKAFVDFQKQKYEKDNRISLSKKHLNLDKASSAPAGG